MGYLPTSHMVSSPKEELLLVNDEQSWVFIDNGYIYWYSKKELASSTRPQISSASSWQHKSSKNMLPLHEVIAVTTQGLLHVVRSQPPALRGHRSQNQANPPISPTAVSNPNVSSENTPDKEEIPPASSNGMHLLVHHVVRSSQRGEVHFKWRVAVLRFTCLSEQSCISWKKRIEKAVRIASPERPKALLVFINPVGGLRTGPRIYVQKVEPLFALCGIKATVITTERANHAKDYILHEDLSRFDGVVCVGGDGMLAEVVTGLLLRARRDYLKEMGSDPLQHGADSVEVTPAWRVGLIPAGSTDCIACSIFGCNDVVTAALHILVGDSLGMDVVSVHSLQGDFLSYNLSLLGYGFYGDLIAESEDFRWMGPKRYDWVGFKKFVGHRSYPGEVAFLPADSIAGHTRDGIFCRARCPVCQESQMQNNALPKASLAHETEPLPQQNVPPIMISPGKWQTVKGNFICVNACLLPARCEKAELGMSPYAHLGNGCTDLILIRNCSRVDFFRHLFRLQDPKSDHFDFEFIEVHRVRAFTFTPMCSKLLQYHSTKTLPTSLSANPVSKQANSQYPLSSPASFSNYGRFVEDSNSTPTMQVSTENIETCDFYTASEDDMQVEVGVEATELCFQSPESVISSSHSQPSVAKNNTLCTRDHGNNAAKISSQPCLSTIASPLVESSTDESSDLDDHSRRRASSVCEEDAVDSVIVTQPSATRGVVTENYTILAPLPGNEGRPPHRRGGHRHQRTLSYDKNHLPLSAERTHQRNSSLHLMLHYSPHHQLSTGGTNEATLLNTPQPGTSSTSRESLKNMDSGIGHDSWTECNSPMTTAPVDKVAAEDSNGSADCKQFLSAEEFHMTSNNARRKDSVAALQLSTWNCDGECLRQPAIYAKVHCQLIRLFARGLEIPEAGRYVANPNENTDINNSNQQTVLEEDGESQSQPNVIPSITRSIEVNPARKMRIRSRTLCKEEDPNAKTSRTQCQCCSAGEF